MNANIKYASLKHTTSCVISFEITGWYECCKTDYNAYDDFDINRKCLVEPTGCHIIKSTLIQMDQTVHWDFDDFNHQFR